MDTPITRAEHEEFRRTVAAEISRLAAEDKRLSARVTDLEDDNAKLDTLTIAVQKLTDSIEQMRQLQENESRRLEVIEGRDGEMWRKVVGYLVTTVLGVVVGYICTQIGLG